MPNKDTVQDLQRMIDRLDIEEVLGRYFFGYATFNIETILSCFTPDAAFGNVVGHDAIRAIMQGLDYFQNIYVTRGSQKISIEGDEAYVEHYAVGFIQRADGGQGNYGRLMVQSARYDDHLIRVDDGWKIKTRRGFDNPDSGHDTTWQFDAVSVPIHLD